MERPDIETIMAELMSGRFNDPIRVIAFNTLEHWAKDISAEIAAEMRVRCDIEGEQIPEYIRDFAAGFPEVATIQGILRRKPSGRGGADGLD